MLTQPGGVTVTEPRRADEPDDLRAALDEERAGRRRAGEALRRSEDFHRLLSECVRDFAIYEIDPAGLITSWNEGARRMLGYEAREALGRHIALTFTEEDRRAGRPQRELDEASASGSASDENWAVRKDGSRFWASGVTTALRDDTGRLRGYVKIFRDLTERRLAEEALRQARDELENRVEERTAELRRAQERALQAERLAAIGTTAAGLAHEGRNALQATLACVERLRWRLAGQPEILAMLAEIEKAQDALARLFEDVRAYAAPVLLDRRPCDLSAVWREAWSRAVAGRPGCDAALTEQTAGVDLTCEADAFRVGQVFRNVFDNALAACPGSARVSVSCAEAERGGRPALVITVRDNGPGLTDEQRRRIFDPFYTTKTQGTGLGMAIARRVMEAHGGDIGVGAGGPGAEIILTLPRRES